ncbi:hypothetical protein VitviT2T_014865 [Vitis vinifera]|uniref:Uncharacterized protein n=1 Tax=Vitis vinifera TaxID=29760 RepID=A0ABY9CLS9_VITVI|nr:hypothetical protein VitviT2T_014865 [Vitis vinifera]
MQNSKGASRAERPKWVDDDIPMEKGTGISAQNQELLVANHSHNQADKSSSRLDCFGAKATEFCEFVRVDKSRKEQTNNEKVLVILRKLELKIVIWLEVDISEEIPCRSVGPNDPELKEQIIQHMATALANAPPDQKRALLFQLTELNSGERSSLLLLPLLPLPPALTSATFPYHVS